MPACCGVSVMGHLAVASAWYKTIIETELLLIQVMTLCILVGGTDVSEEPDAFICSNRAT